MEKNIFKLVVYAIIVVVLLYLFFFHFAPLYLWPEKPETIVENQLKRAETDLGHYSHQPSGFPEEFTVQAMGYETPHRSIVFECNDEILCCPKGKKCQRPIEWDNNAKKRYFTFKEYKPVEVSARCRYEDIYICKVFLGKQPAQVSISEIELQDSELDLTEKKTTKIKYKIKNTGKKDMIAVQGTARVYKIKRLPFGQEPEKTFIGEFKDEEFSLERGAETEREIQIQIKENGEYQIEFTAFEKTDETNYEKKTIELKATGLVEIGACIPKPPIEEWYSELECRYYLPCEDCKSIEECKRKWREELDLPPEFDEFGLSEVNDHIVITVDGKIIEGQECEKLCYEDWDVLKELEKSDKSLEVFIVLDASGSMQQEIFELKNTIREIVDSLKEGCQTKRGEPCVKIGIYVIEGFSATGVQGVFEKCVGEDCPAGSYDDVGQIPITSDLEKIVTGLSGIPASGGIEPWGDVIIYALGAGERLGWNPNSFKGIIVMTDEPHNGGKYTFADALNRLKEKQIPAFTVWSELYGPSGPSKQQLIDLGTETGGSSESYLSETEIPELLLRIITILVRKAARAENIKLCDEAICPEECSCDWYSYPGRQVGEKEKCSEQVCEACARERCLPMCVPPGEKRPEEIIREPLEDGCNPLQCLEDLKQCKTWFLCKCQGINMAEFGEECKSAWQEQHSGIEFKIEPGKARVYIEGTCNEFSEGECIDCELPKIEGCAEEEHYSECQALSMKCICDYPEAPGGESFTPEGQIIFKPPMVVIPTQPAEGCCPSIATQYHLQQEPVLCHGLAYVLARQGRQHGNIRVYRISGPNDLFPKHNAGPYVVVSQSIENLELFIREQFGSSYPNVSFYTREDEIRIDPKYVSQIRALDTCIVDGTYDQPSQIFSEMNIPFRPVNLPTISEIDSYFNDCEALVVGCAGRVQSGVFEKTREFVERGGILIATDGLNNTENIALGAFPERLGIEERGDSGLITVYEGYIKGEFDLPVKLKKFFQVPNESFPWRIASNTTVFSLPLHSEVKALAYYEPGKKPAVLMFEYGKGAVFHCKFHMEGSRDDATKAGLMSAIYSGFFSEKLLLYPPECNTRALKGEKVPLCPQKEAGHSLMVSNLFTDTIRNIRLKALVDGSEVPWIEFSKNNFDLSETEFVTVYATIPESIDSGEHPLKIIAEADNALPTEINGIIHIISISPETGEEEISCTKTHTCQNCASAEECIRLWRARNDSIPEEVQVRTQNEFYYEFITYSEGERKECK